MRDYPPALRMAASLGARLALATALIVAPPLVGRPEAEPAAGPADAGTESAGAQDAPSATDTVGAIVDEEVRENDFSAEVQQRINELSEDIDAMTSQYHASVQNARQLKVYNGQLEQLIAAQDEEMASLRRQIDEVTSVSRRLMPHMEEMLDTLAQIIEIDVPFLIDERRERVAKLEEMMGRADVTIAEKYRRLLEAYQIENEYGRTIEAYRGTLATDGDSRTVDFLRVGRVALLYQTLDGQESGVWNQADHSWRPANDYRTSVRDGLRMARKQRAPDLVRVPVPAAEVVQ